MMKTLPPEAMLESDLSDELARLTGKVPFFSAYCMSRRWGRQPAVVGVWLGDSAAGQRDASGPPYAMGLSGVAALLAGINRALTGGCNDSR